VGTNTIQIDIPLARLHCGFTREPNPAFIPYSKGDMSNVQQSVTERVWLDDDNLWLGWECLLR